MTRERHHRVINLGGETVSESVEMFLPDADFTERFRQLKASTEAQIAAGGGGPVLKRHAHLVCDGCGQIAILDYDDPGMPKGWEERENGDFCANC